MKKSVIILMFCFWCVAGKAQDPIAAIIKAGIKKVIVAIDLKIQRLQTKTIWLQNVQKIIENNMSQVKLGDISDWVQKQKDLYKNYFEELWKVKDVITFYHRIREITAAQLSVIKEYHRGWKAVAADNHFTAKEIEYVSSVYTGIVNASIKNLDQLSLIVKSFSTQMTDAKRMEIINSCAAAIEKNLSDIKSFNAQNYLLSLQRAKDNNEITIIKSLYQLN